MDHKLPNLLIAGYHKAGTTTLFHELSRHPDIFPSVVKEPFYFRPYINGKPLAPIETYTKNFQGAKTEQYRMEGSPTYIYGGMKAAKKIQETLGDIKVIISLRDPAEQLFSLYKHHLRFMKLPENTDFQSFVTEHADLSRQHYVAHLDAWVEIFGNDLKLIFFHELIENPERVFEELTTWLGIPGLTLENQGMINANPGSGYRFARFHKLALGLFRRMKAILPHQLFVKVRRWYFALNGKHLELKLTAEDRTLVHETLKTQNRDLKNFLVKQRFEHLPDWLGSVE